MRKEYTWNTKNLNMVLGIDSDIEVITESYEIESNSGCDGVNNGFYGKRHTEETKKLLREKTLELCKNEKFKMTRANFGEKNGMYQSARFGELNPMWKKKHSGETKLKQSNKRKEWFKNNENPMKGRKLSKKQKEQISERNSKEYTLINPNGETVKIKNLTKFARDNNLSIGCLQQLVAGRNKTHRGWKNA